MELERTTQPLHEPASGGATVPLGEARVPRLEADELVLDRYRLRRRLGAGGFGVVWLALDERLEREVAVKAVAREGGQAWQRAEREARAAARLTHPGIVALYELGVDRERAYLISEYVDGRTFAELLDGGISDRDVARVGEAMCDALAHAHGRGVVHRDLKPQNIMVVAEPAAGAGFAKLADFGASRLAAEDGLTRTGDVVGTLAYMSPEQAEGDPATEASDLYSLALTLYEGLAGENPVRGAGVAETARRLGRPVVPLARARPDLPSRLRGAIDRALDPDPSWRGDLQELREGLAGAGATLSAAGGLDEPSTLERFGLTPRRRGWLDRLRASRLELRDPPPEPSWQPSPEDAEAVPTGPGRGGALLARLAAAAAAAALVAAALGGLAPGRPPVEPALGALVAGGAVALLPRLGWLACATALVVWLALPGGNRQGFALFLLALVAVVPALLPRAGTLWSATAGAAALGAVGLAGAFPALAGLVRGPTRRALLAVGAYLWLVAAEVLTGERLLFGAPEDAGSRRAWAGSGLEAVRQALAPLASSPVLVPALVWALFAAALPLAVRGRALRTDAVLGGAWCAGLVAAHWALGQRLAEWGLSTAPRGLVGGAVLGVAVAVVAAPVLRRIPPG